LIKISKLYKIYGNDQVALVNPGDRPGIIQVKKRSQIKERVYKQMGLHSQGIGTNYENSIMMSGMNPESHV